jgi:hypothetical protein
VLGRLPATRPRLTKFRVPRQPAPTLNRRATRRIGRGDSAGQLARRALETLGRSVVGWASSRSVRFLLSLQRFLDPICYAPRGVLGRICPARHPSQGHPRANAQIRTVKCLPARHLTGFTYSPELFQLNRVPPPEHQRPPLPVIVQVPSHI